MPISIPYNHPSLVIGNVANTEVMNVITEMVKIQSETDAAQEKLDSFIRMKRSMTMTLAELKGLIADETQMELIQKQIDAVDANIKNAALAYMNIFVENEGKLLTQKEKLAKCGTEVKMPESPIDARSQLVAKPFYSDSLKLDSQYFSISKSTVKDAIPSVKTFVQNSAGGSQGKKLAQSASEQLAEQANNHNLTGTLVIVASCMHRNIGVLDPLLIDPDKAISAWNFVHKGNEIVSPEQQEMSKSNQNDEDYITLITGAAYGSSFVGMVHMFQSAETGGKDLENVKPLLEEKLRNGAFINGASGGIGVDADTLKEVKELISSRSISTHVTMASMGVIPTIASSKMEAMVISSFGDNLLNASSSFALGSVGGAPDTSARQSLDAHRALEVKQKNLNGALKSMAEVDRINNNAMDISTLITAVDNYFSMVSSVRTEGKIIGVPISFYTHRLTRAEIMDAWAKKYLVSDNQSKEDEDEKNK